MNAEQLEAEALKLDTHARTRLAERLWASLDGPNDEEWTKIWTAEALRRSAEMDADPNASIPAEEVFDEIFKKLKRS